MATRIQGTYYSFGRRPGTGSTSRSTWVVYIDDADYSGATLPVDLTSLRFTHQPSDDTIYASMLTTACELSLIVDTNDLDDFVTDQIDFEEGRFTIRVTKDGFLYFAGFLLPDLVRTEMAPIELGYSFSIKATDGLARLKTIDFSDGTSPYTGEATVFDLLFLCLEKVGLNQYWSSGGSQVYMYIQSTWWASEHTGKATTANFTPNTRINHRVWRKIDTRNGAIIYRSTWDVLDTILRAFGLRLTLSYGSWFVTEVAQYAATGVTIRYQAYAVNKAVRSPLSGSNWAGFKRTTGTVAQWNAGTRDLMVSPNSEETFYPPLQKSIVVYKHYSTANLIAGINWSTANVTAELLEDVDHNSGASRISLAFTLSCRLSDSSVTDYTAIPATWFQLNVLISVTDGSTTYYLRRDATIDAGVVTFSDISWSTTSSHRYQIWVGPQTIDNSTITNQINLITPPLPISGDVSVLVIYNAAARLDGVLAPSGTRTITYATSGTYLEVFADGNVEDQYAYSRYVAINSDTNNSETQEQELIIGSGPTLNAYGAVRVYNGTAWVKPTGWGRLAAGTYTQDLGQLLAQERLGMQDKPVKRWSGNFQGDYVTYYLMVRSHDSATYIPQQVTYDAATEVWQGTWVQVGYNVTKVSLNPTQQFISNPLGGADADAPPGLTEVLPGLRALHGTLFADRYDGGVNRQSSTRSGLDTGITEFTPLVLTTALVAGATITSLIYQATLYNAVAPLQNLVLYKNDQVIVIHPITGVWQVFTISATSFSNFAAVTTATALYDFPAGSYLRLSAFYFQRSTQDVWRARWEQVTLFGRTATVTTGVSEQFITVGLHKLFTTVSFSFVTFGTGTLTLVVKKNGTTTVSATVATTAGGFITAGFAASYVDCATHDIITFEITAITGTAPIGMALICGFV